MEKDLESYIAGLPEEEQKKHKDLIAECRQRATELNGIRQENVKRPEEINQAFGKILNELPKISENSDKVIENLKKAETNLELTCNIAKAIKAIPGKLGIA